MSVTEGFRLLPGYFDRGTQVNLLEQVRDCLIKAPFFTPVMPRSGKPFSVVMSNCGSLGWVSDKSGYRYEPKHPKTGDVWPPIPDPLRALWHAESGLEIEPEACLINYYKSAAKLGLHQDRDEKTFDAPVISVSLGDTALFRIGGTKRSEPTRSVRLASGDVAVLGGPARLAYHGIDRIVPETSTLLPEGGRINLTLRRVTPW